MQDTPVAQPLAGRRIIDLGQVLATPTATYLCGLLGAEVVKVEPIGGEWLRRVNTPVGFSTQNAGKRSLAIDMRAPGAAEVVLRLTETADVFVQGFAPGTAEAMGLGIEAVRRRSPAIVYASLSAYGEEGPYAGRPAFDHVVQAMSGIMPATGFEGSPPTKVGAPFLDYGTGLLLAFGILAALLERDRTGEGVDVDAAMLDLGLFLNASGLVRAANGGGNPPRTGNNAFSGAAASGSFETSDGLLMVAANKVTHFARLAELLELHDLAAEPTIGLPGADPDEVATARVRIAERFATRSAAEWETLLNAEGIPSGRVRSLTEVVDEGHPIARGLLHHVPDPSPEAPDRTRRLPGVGVRLNGTMPGPDGLAPSVGTDTRAILTDAGFGGDEIDSLVANGVVALAD